MHYVIGIDEVGRGCLAGPVVVGAALIPKNLRLPSRRLGKLSDSKRLTKRKREEWVGYFKGHPRIFFSIARVGPRGVDRLNISNAANLAAWRAFGALKRKAGVTIASSEVYLDGGLYLKKKGLVAEARTVVRGDESIRAVQIASIVAKVERDRLMTSSARHYPGYGFEIHKGYGTRSHRDALIRLGQSDIHRLTFLRFLQNSKRKR